MHVSADIEKLLADCEQASKKGVDQELLWDWGKAWCLLGSQSGEVGDFKQAVSKFAQADAIGCELPHFRLDYGEALLALADLLGDPHYAEQALDLFKRAGGAVMYAKGCKLLFELTGSQEHYTLADTSFRDAILAEPHEIELWVDWGELHLQEGWLSRDPKIIETALEKFTSKATKGANPFRLTAYVGRGLVILGYLLEDLRLIQDGKGRILSILELAPAHPDLIYAAGIAHLFYAMYFSDVHAFAYAVTSFKEGLALDARQLQNWYGLFQAYSEWGLVQEDGRLLERGFDAIQHLAGSLRPHCFCYWNEWGVALLRSREFFPSPPVRLLEAVERFKKAWELSLEWQPRYNWACALDRYSRITCELPPLEEALTIFHELSSESPHSVHFRFPLARALSHYGEITGDVDSLFQANMMLEQLKEWEEGAEELWCQLGYNYLLLSELVSEEAFPEKGEEMRRKAEKALLHAAEIGAGEAYYQLACLYSLSHCVEAALHYLHKAAQAFTLPSAETLEDEEWLEAVRQTEDFRHFLMQRRDG